MCRKALVAVLVALALFALAPRGQEKARPSLKPSAPTPALLPWAPQSGERCAPIEAFKKEAPPLAARFERGSHTSAQGEVMPYRLFRPKVGPGKKYPLVLFLHGSSGSGTDNELQLQKANMFGSVLWTLPRNQEKHPCFVLVPQSEVNWPPVKLVPDKLPEILPGLGAGCRLAVEIVEGLLAKEPIDPTRIYVTGHSMGGAGTWTLISLRPDLFAAGVPVAGRADLGEIPGAARVAVWSFHGLKDEVEPVQTSREILAALQASGGKPLYTEYPEVEHNSFMWAYTEPALVEWLFSQKRPGQAPSPAAKAAH
jgi:predicted peptidase